MTRTLATTPGLYPLPDWAKSDLSELKGHQKEDLITGDEPDAVQDVYGRARQEAIDRQRAAGLDLIVEGQLRWDDMLAHPLAVHANVETRGIVRYYDNNNFYREPVVTGDLDFDGDVATELEAASAASTDDFQAVLPGPYSLASLATDEHYGDAAAFQSAIADFLAAELAAIPATETVFLLEPSLVTDPPGEGADRRASAAIDTVAAVSDAPVVVFPYWGALDERVYAHLLDADVEGVGYDLVSAADANVYNIQEYGAPPSVALGVVDGQNTLVESPSTIRDRLTWFREQTPVSEFETVYATTNTELFYLPVNKFEAKLDALAAATTAVEA